MVIGVLRLVTSTQGLLSGRDVMMPASFSLQDPLGIFFMVFMFANKLSYCLLHHWFATQMMSKSATVSCTWCKLVLCSIMHEKVVLSNSRSVFLMENNGWFICSCGVPSGKPVHHLLSSYSCTPPHCILCLLLSRPLLPPQVCVFSMWHRLYWLYLLLHRTMTCQSCLWTGQLQWYHTRI